MSWCTDTAARGDLVVGPGDDAAVLADGTVITVDAVVEGVHFSAGSPLDAVAAKALGSAVSDICAMGARAEAALVSAQLPEGVDGRSLADSLRSHCEGLGVVLAGGDTVRSPVLALSVTVTGHVRSGRPWLRSGGRPGDILVVTGPLGGSPTGRHLRPRPRADVVAWLRADGVEVHAALDLSDGLGRDLPRLCGASGVGAVVEVAALPVHSDVTEDRTGWKAVLGDGEDYELLLALPEPPVGAGPGALSLTAIGRLTQAPELVLDHGDRRAPWPPLGYEHGF